MARIRTIKPEFWTSEQVMECEPLSRLLFIGIWNFCDDAGNHPLSEKTLKALVFPADDIDSATIRRLIDDLSANGLLTLYTHSGKVYLHVNGWHHQKIEKPTIKHPEFTQQAAENAGLNEGMRPVAQVVADHSTTDRRPFDDGKEGEGKGKGIDQKPAAVVTAPKPKRKTKSALPNPFLLSTDMAKWARERAPAADLNLETEKFCNHWRAKGETRADWHATWRNWMLNAQQFAGRRQRPIAEPDFEDTSWANDLGPL